MNVRHDSKEDDDRRRDLILLAERANLGLQMGQRGRRVILSWLLKRKSSLNTEVGVPAHLANVAWNWQIPTRNNHSMFS
jgi:hypothetical protein